ncbi:xanthine dehydrogenase small subunit [Polaromonas sp. DSR2-3-2]|uniref:xanthine dehydrogenase small subunit n=1 Tax=unclassified Polaromonas TaxID=2638319 RepID=UPI003CF6E0FD
MTIHPLAVQPAVKNIRFIRKGEVVNLGNVPPERTVLELLREDLGCTGTKEGCGEGDCGACTVVLGQIEDGALRLRAVNSCIRLAHSIDGMALWTVEDIAPTLVASRTALPPEGALRQRPGEAGSAAPAGEEVRAEPTLHPAQQAMVDCHASQCGFCTPGFVMSLFGMYHNHVSRGEPVTRAMAQEELSGNLCRCTGYRPILDAAQHMASLPPVVLDENTLLSKLELLAQAGYAQEPDSAYKLPYTLAELLRLRAAHPAAQLVAGCTDVGLWVTKQHRQLDEVIDLTQVEELRHIEDQPDQLLIGAAVTLADAFAALANDRPQLHPFASRFAGLPVRNSGTLGGNIANGSPIGDSMPLLIALRARIVLVSGRGRREMPLENLYTGYRTNVMAADEVLAFIRVPKPGSAHPCPLPEGEGVKTGTDHRKLPTPLAPSPLRGKGGGEGRPEFLRIYKISKRYDDDISAVCLAINLQIEKGIVTRASIGAGGVAATPARAFQTETFLTGQPWTLATVQGAMAVLRAEFSPLSDMRASASYRSEVLGNLLQRYWLESQGVQQINLESFVLEERA